MNIVLETVGKKHNTDIRKRLLGIPTIEDRVAQMVLRNAKKIEEYINNH